MTSDTRALHGRLEVGAHEERAERGRREPAGDATLGAARLRKPASVRLDGVALPW